MAGDQNSASQPDVETATTRVEQLERELADLRAESESVCEALRVSEKRLAEVFRLAPSFMCMLGGPDHVFQLANEPYHQLLGHRDFLGKSLAEAVPEAAGQVFPRLLGEVYRTGEPFVGTDMPLLLQRTPGGPPEEVSIDFVYVPMRGPDGAVTGILVQGTDITERKRHEAALRASEAQLAEVFRLAPSFICKLRGPDHVFELINERFNQIAGRRDFLGKPAAEAMPEVAGQGFIRLLDAVYRTGEPFVGAAVPITLQRTPGGPPEDRFLDFVYMPVRGPDGAVTGILCQGIDVTERKQVEDTFREGQQFFHSSIDALASNIAVLDEAGVILAVNDAWRRFADDNRYGIPDYGVGRNYFEGVGRGTDPDAEAGLVAEGIADVLSGRRELFEMEYPCHSPTEQRWFVVRVTRFKSPKPVRVVVAHENVTLRKKSEIALWEANRRKDEFLATLAHELRNPLAPIRTGLHVLKTTGNDSAAAEATRGMMERQLGQMVRLVDDLLDISRISSGKLDLRRERVELAAVVRSAVETSRPLIDRQGHELTVALPPGPVPLDADPVRLAQVFSNLLTNAAKYSERGGRIWLTAEVQSGGLVVRVRDAGIGIDPGQLARVFDMFAQVQTALEKSQGGLGIGLSLVKGLVAMHGGTVEVTSAGPGHGSEFVVRLPVATGPSAETAAPVEEIAARRPASRRVLIVDDNVDAADSLGELLAFAGHAVRTAYDGFAGLAAAAEFRPDVILLDLGMPKLNGYEAARRVREEVWGASIVLVALTGWGSADDRRKTRAVGFDHHFVKPVEPAAILKLLAAPVGV